MVTIVTRHQGVRMLWFSPPQTLVQWEEMQAQCWGRSEAADFANGFLGWVSKYTLASCLKLRKLSFMAWESAVIDASYERIYKITVN